MKTERTHQTHKKTSMKTLFLLIVLGVPLNVNAAMGIAVVKDEDNSTTNYVAKFAEKSWKAESIARKELRAKGHKKVYGLSGQEKYGHHLSSGYYVIVVGTRKYNGKTIRSVGLGCSSSSYAEAEKRAIKHLMVYDWSWNKSDSYSIDKKGSF